MRLHNPTSRTLALIGLFFVLCCVNATPASALPRDSAIESLCYIHTLDQAQRQEVIAQRLIIDNADQDGFVALLNPEEIERLTAQGLWVDVLETPEQRNGAKPDGYYSYATMSALLSDLAEDYPDLTELFSIGRSVDGRELWVLKISDNAATNEPEPEVWFDGGTHGDEWSGFEAAINLAVSLLQGYDSDATASALVDGLEIYVLPMLNPDGCVDSTRYNSHGEDLNRSFPIFYEGAGVGGTEPEVLAVTEFFLSHALSFGATYHSGAEVVNYPMDSQPQRAPDDATLSALSQIYGNAASYSITNGYDWYEAQGISEETYYLAGGALAFIVEVSSTKTPSYSEIPGYNARNLSGQLALLQALGSATSGTVRDASTGAPLFAMLRFVEEGWAFYTDPENGDFHRYMRSGGWTCEAWANGYTPLRLPADRAGDDKDGPAFELDPAETPEYYAMRVVANDRADGWTHNNPSMPLAALAASDGVAYSLGNGGYVVLDMGPGTPIVDSAGPDLSVVEAGADPEGALVYVGAHWLGPWTLIGVATGTTDLDISASGLSSARYVKLVDDGGTGGGSAPGFDLDALVAKVPCALPQVDFSADVTSGPAPLSVNFTPQIDVLPGCLYGQYWNFGDNGSSTEHAPDYVYQTPGVYSVTLTAIGAAGDAIKTRTDYITVTAGDDDDDDSGDDDSGGDDDDDEACCG